MGAMLVSALSFVTAAQAADMPVKAPAIAPVYDWNGFYAGVNIGGGWGHSSADYASNDVSSILLFSPGVGGLPPSASIKSAGVLGGFTLGYNWQVNPTWLVGLETDFDFANVTGSDSGPAQVTGGHPVTATLNEQLDFLGTVRGRLGYLPTPNLLLFATGGFAYGRINHSGSYQMTAGGGIGSANSPSFVCFAGVDCFNGSDRSWAGGWTVGGGFEYAFAPRWTLKAEYLHVTLDAKSLTETAAGPFPGFTGNSTFNANYSRSNFDFVRVGLNLQF